MEHDSETCMDRCRFRAEHCWMDEDGTWDCSTAAEECRRRCGQDVAGAPT